MYQDDPAKTPTPAAPAVTPEPPTPSDKVEFSPAQQAKLEEIIKSVTGRVASDLRRQNAAKDAEIEKLKADLSVAERGAAPDAAESDRLRAQLQQSEREKQEMQQSFAQKNLQSQILIEAERAQFVSASQAAKLVRDNVKIADDGSTVIMDDSGNVREGVTLPQFMAEFASKNEWAVKGTTRPGSGSGPAASIPPATLRPEDYFGKGSNAAAANRLSLQNPSAYRALRAQAVKKGLVA
jgi:hypothetical protein